MAKAAELMKVVPTLVVPAAYVGLLSDVNGDLVVRTFSEDGQLVAEVAGPFTDTRVWAVSDIAFIRGATENSVEGCSFAWMGGDGNSSADTGEDDLYVLDIEAADLVAVATTNRPALGGGDCLLATVRAGADGFWYECGQGGQGGDNQGYLRKIHRDGVTSIAAVVADIPPITETSTPVRPYPINATQWAIDDLDSGDQNTVNEAGTVVLVPSVDGMGNDQANSVTAALVLGSTAGTTTKRVVLNGATYELQDLWSIGGFSVLSAGTLRDGSLIAIDGAGASRLATWGGSHPITTGTAGPTFAFNQDDEALHTVWGL